MSLDNLRALKKQKYPNPDITTPMSDDEKALDKEIADRFSDQFQEIRERRKENLKRMSTEERYKKNGKMKVKGNWKSVVKRAKRKNKDIMLY